MTGAPELHLLPDDAALFEAAAVRIVELGDAAIRTHGAFHLALAGGNTPRGLYRRLSEPDLAARLNWRRVAVWFGDERCVPPDHPDSNYLMAHQSLLARLPVPPGEVHRMAGELPPEEAAADYAAQIARHLPRRDDSPPCFDLILLGLGPDGHVASLFPGTNALAEVRPAAPVYVERLGVWRITLTLPMLSGARHLLLLATGAGKAEVVRRALREPPGADPLPVQRLAPAGGFEWFLDAAAAGGLAERTS